MAMDRRDDAGEARDLAPVEADAMLNRLVRLAACAAGTSAAVFGRTDVSNGPVPALVAFGLSQHEANAAVDFDEALRRCPGLTVLPDLGWDERFAGHALVAGPPHLRFLAHLPLFSAVGERCGFLCVLDPAVRLGHTEAQETALGDAAALIVAACDRERRAAHLLHAATHALRADHMLRLVAEAGSCADALTSLLGELCRFHGARVGRIWQLTQPDELMREVSRFNDPLLDEHSYYRPTGFA